MVIALLALLALLMIKDQRPSTVRGFAIALALGMIVYVLQTAPLFQTISARLIEIALVAVSNGNNPLFWFFIMALFDDEFRASGWQLALWVLVVCFAGMTLLTHDAPHSLDPMSLHVWAHCLLGWLPLLFGGLSIAAVVKHWRADLVERRRWLRAFIVVAGFIYMLGTGVARLATLDGRLTNSSSLLDMLGLAAIVFVFAWRLLSLEIGDLFASPQSPTQNFDDPFGPEQNRIAMAHQTPVLQAPARQTNRNSAEQKVPQPDSAEHHLVASLERLITGQQIFREENLTISRLAAKLAVPEYRLRRLINQRLGYRNFNAYLNAYRLKHVVAAMANPKSAQLPILTIALDAGFQSIGPFNRAFKSQFEMTPTEFRAKHQGVSRRLEMRLFSVTLAALLSLQGCAQLSPLAIRRSVQLASASIGQILCTTTFVSGIDPADTYRDEIRPTTGFGLINWALRYEVDRDRREITTTIFGIARRRAVYREGLGCMIDFGTLPATT